MTTRECSQWISAQLAGLDQAKAGTCAVILALDELLVKTGVGGAWDEINAQIIQARHDAEHALAWFEERTQTLEDVLRQLNDE